MQSPATREVLYAASADDTRDRGGDVWHKARVERLIPNGSTAAVSFGVEYVDDKAPGTVRVDPPSHKDYVGPGYWRTGAESASEGTNGSRMNLHQKSEPVSCEGRVAYRFARDGCSTVLKNKASEASHASSHCHFRHNQGEKKDNLNITGAAAASWLR